MEHKTKYKQLTEAYLHALGVITESTATWQNFSVRLRTPMRNDFKARCFCTINGQG